MDLFAFIFGLSAFGTLAARYGHDSRDLGFRSYEQRLAELGMRWGDAQRPRKVRTRGLAHSVRHSIALALYRLAHWLAPEVSRAAG